MGRSIFVIEIKKGGNEGAGAGAGEMAVDGPLGIGIFFLKKNCLGLAPWVGFASFDFRSMLAIAIVNGLVLYNYTHSDSAASASLGWVSWA